MICVVSYTNLGKNIRYLRQCQNLSLEEFAAILGIAPADLNTIETADIVEIDAGLFQNICDFFHMDMQCLVEENLVRSLSVL